MKPITAFLCVQFLLVYAPVTLHAQEDNVLLSDTFWKTATVVDVEAALEGGATPLHFATGYSETPAVVKLLLEHGADIEARSEGGLTPLHVAETGSKHPEVLESLLKNGADPQAKDKKGKTPFERAQDNEDLKDTEVYWLLQESQYH
ncbi:MAG: ankyrin repeat domain-containing protein [Parvularculales bacterium]